MDDGSIAGDVALDRGRRAKARHVPPGIAAALLSAVAWAVGSILFRRVGERASPAAMNLGKSLLGLLMLGVVVVLCSGRSPSPWSW